LPGSCVFFARTNSGPVNTRKIACTSRNAGPPLPPNPGGGGILLKSRTGMLRREVKTFTLVYTNFYSKGTRSIYLHRPYCYLFYRRPFNIVKQQVSLPLRILTAKTGTPIPYFTEFPSPQGKPGLKAAGNFC